MRKLFFGSYFAIDEEANVAFHDVLDVSIQDGVPNAGYRIEHSL